MSKKLVSLILSVIMLVSVLTGCSLFEKNVEKDMKQVLAEIDIIEETKTIDGETVRYTSEEIKKIYKYQLIEALYGEDGNSLMQNGATLEQAAEQLLNNLITSEIIIIDIEKKIKFKEIDWRDGETKYDDGKYDFTDENAVMTIIYNAIDSSINSIKNEIHTERGLDLPTISFAEAPSSSTTYPIQEDENVDKDIVIREEESFAAMLDKNRSRWPGYFGTEADKSLGREAMRRFVALIKDRVEDNYAVTELDKEKFIEDDKLIDKTINTQGIEALYPMLSELHYVEFLVGKNARKQVMIDRLGEHLSDNVVVTDNEIKNAYNAKVTAQKLSFDADEAAYATAIKGGQDIYYYPNGRYFFVKHILLPFNAEQSEKLSTFKSSGKRTPTQIEAYRRMLVNEIKVYPHVNGEDDLDNPTTVNAVFTQLKAEMAAASTNLRVAERTFDKFIYLYNTDPGIFNQPKGYPEVPVLYEGESESYMVEFAKIARELYESYQPGQVHPDFAITDYGVHIMYYASKTFEGHEVQLTDYQTPGQYKTYYDIIKEEIEAQREDEEFEKWRVRTIVYYENIEKVVTKYEDRYADILE